MAKKKELTEEKRLEQALVPESEWPYELPEGWKWVRLGGVLIPNKEKTSEFNNENLKYIGLEHIKKGNGIYSYGSVLGIKSTKTVFYEGQILYGRLRPYLNKHDIAKYKGICSTDILVFDTTSKVDARYINYIFDISAFIEYASANSTGINLPRVSEKVILDFKVPLPSIQIQKQIVEQIESLFSKLEEAKEKVESVLESSENRRSAILHKAFTGELTKKWREENGDILASSKGLIDPKDLLDKDQEPYKIPDSWSWSTLDQVADIIMGQSPAGKDTTEDSCFTPLIGGAADMGELYPAITRYTKSPKKVSKEGDLILSIRATLGRPIYSDGEYCLGRGVAAIRSANISKEFLKFFFLAFEKYLYNNSTGSTFSQVSSAVLKKIPFPIMPIDEQELIVEILGNMIIKEETAINYSDRLSNQIEEIRKSILTMTFRGL